MLALALAVVALLPARGVLVPHESLAGVRLGDTPAQVRAAVGTRFTICRGCDEPTWFYFERGAFTGGETGLGVTFRSGRVAAVYTLGMPVGWRTRDGLKVGDDQARMRRLYGGLKLTACTGYMAHSVRRPRTVTTFFTIESLVSGFALTVPSEPVCR